MQLYHKTIIIQPCTTIIIIILLHLIATINANDNNNNNIPFQNNQPLANENSKSNNNNKNVETIYRHLDIQNHQHNIKFLNTLQTILRDEKYHKYTNDNNNNNNLYKRIEKDLIHVFNEETHERHFGKNFTSESPRTVSVALSVDGKQKKIYVNEYDHIASITAKFCLEENLDSVDSCYKLFRELTRHVFSLTNTKAKPVYLPKDERTATLILPIITRFHPTNQRLYFDVEELPSLSSTRATTSEKKKNEKSTYCFYLDFDMNTPAWCGQVPVGKPIYSESGISKGIHLLHLVRDQVAQYSTFFEVMDPSITIELGRVFHPSFTKKKKKNNNEATTDNDDDSRPNDPATRTNQDDSRQLVEMECLISIIGGFKPGVHGNICFNMDGEMYCYYNKEYIPNNISYPTYGKNNTIENIFVDTDLYDPITGLTKINAEDLTLKTQILIPLNGGKRLNPIKINSETKYRRKHCVYAILKSYYHDAKAIAISDELCFNAEHPFDMQNRYIDYENQEITLNVGSAIDILAGENELTWLHDLHLHEWGIYSQNGEDGILLSILRNLKIGHFYVDDKNIPDELQESKRPIGNRFYVEFGTEDGMECNTRILREKCKWKGLLMDGGHENAEINLNIEFITAANINELFEKHHVPENEFDLLIIDIDFNDFWVWKNINHEKYKPRIVIIEYNGNIPMNESKVVKRDDTHIWSDSSYCGASLLAMQRLGASLGYTLIYAESHGVNAFFIRTDILYNRFKVNEMAPGEIDELNKLLSIEHIYRQANYFGKGWWYHDMDPEQMKQEGKSWVRIE